MLPILRVFVVLFAALSTLHAHSDPRGDVHPTVRVENGGFVVQAYDNVASNDAELHTSKSTFDCDGRLIKEVRDRVPPPKHVPYSQYSLIDRLPEEHNGLERQWGDGVLIIPEWSRKHGGKPFVIEYRDKIFKYHRLSWKSSAVQEVVDARIVGNRLYLLVTRSGSNDGIRLNLHRFSLVTVSEEASTTDLPQPCLIWSSPVCSNIIEYQGRIYIGIVTPRFFGYRLVLADWDGVAPTCLRKTLTTRIDWNTSLSLANVGENALIAYHYPGAYPTWSFSMNPLKASIKTVSFKLK